MESQHRPDCSLHKIRSAALLRAGLWRRGLRLAASRKSSFAIHLLASLFFVEYRVVDSLALTVFPSLGGDPRFSVGRDHDARREGSLAALLTDGFVGTSIDF
jgi:hypothetical protein